MTHSKYLLFLVLFTVFSAIGLGFYGSQITSRRFGWPNTYQVDTVYVNDTIRDTIKADTIYRYYNEFVTPINNIKVDTITTYMNGAPINSDVKVIVKDISLLK